MNWLQKAAQTWIESHPDYDIGNHLHAAFSAVLPISEGREWEETPDVFYIPSSTYRFKKGVAFGGFFFMYKNRMYRLNVIITKGENPIDYMKMHGFSGTLTRSFDSAMGTTINEDLGNIYADNPFDFIGQVIDMIKADKFDDDEDDGTDDDIYPQWPYAEDEFTEESEKAPVLSRPRLRYKRDEVR